jgi:hypothetical protein
VAEDQAEDTFGDYPPFAMTGYSQGGYVVSASSEYLSDVNALRNAYKVYNATTGTAGVWMTDFGTFNPNAVGGDTFTDSNGGTHTGHWNKVELPYKLKPSYFYFKNSGTFTGSRNATNWVILGSNNDSDWDLLHSSTTLLNATKRIPITATKGYTYLMFLCKSINADSALYMDEMRFYGHRENDLVRLPDPTNVLKYPHVVMTGPAQRGYTTREAQLEVNNDTLQTRAWKAFRGTLVDGTDCYFGLFVSGQTLYYNADGTWNSASYPNVKLSSQTPAGDYITLGLPHKLVLNSFDLTPRNLTDTNRAANESADSFEIWGSNDNSTWYHINTYDNSTDQPSSITPRTFTVNWANSTSTPNVPTGYKHIGLVVKKIFANLYSSNRQIFVLGRWRLYGTGVDSIPIQIGGGNIDKVANFRVYDKFVGEDQALEIWDAQKDEFGRAKSSMTLQKGRLGIGTTEPEGRLAVLDEPHNLEEFPPRAMTGYKTYFEGHGEFRASASSYYGTYYPWQAFDRNITDNSSDQAVWHTTADFTTATPGIYNAGASLGGYTGAWLKLKLPYSIKPSKVSIHPRTYPGGTSNFGQNPLDFLILGSKDDITWDVLSTQVGVVFGTTWKEFILSPANNNYKYFAISCTKTKSGSYFAICDMKYFGTREQGQSVLHDGQLTLTKSLTVPRIGPALDADDTPRRDRLVVEYNTSTNPTFEGAVRDTSGRGFDGTLVGGATYDATEKALVFDGDGDYIRMRDWNYGTGFIHSFSGWVKIKSPEESWTVLYGVGDAPGGNRTNFTIWTLTSSNYFRSEADGSGSYIDHTFEFTGNMNKWMHVAVVKSGAAINTTRMYINGDILPQSGGSNASLSTALPNSPQNFTLGTYAPSPASEINADYSNIKFYDTALTAEEVKTLYDMGRCDEGHHVVNFSKTRVGIGLGDGEAPRGALDVRGDIYGGCPVYFQALYNANFSATAYNNSTNGALIPWNTLFEHKGDCFDTSTGLFTAPIDGVYSFGYSLRKQTGSYDDFWTYVQKNGVVMVAGGGNHPGRVYVDGGSSGASVFASQRFILDLSAGDTVGILLAESDVAGTDARISNSYNYFHGYYIGTGNGSFGSYSY